MSKHTPWEAVLQPDGTYIIKEPSKHHRCVPGVTITACGKIIAWGVPPEHAAKLAAAPDLLAACKDMLGSDQTGVMDVDDWKAWKRHAEDAARVAIAKAEVESCALR